MACQSCKQDKPRYKSTTDCYECNVLEFQSIIELYKDKEPSVVELFISINTDLHKK